MPKIDNNLLVKGARGNMGGQYVYKKRGDHTHIALMPTVNKNAEPTERQEEVRDLFSDAATYAKGAIASSDLKKEYEKKAPEGANAYNVAFRDFLKSPKVKAIIAAAYTGVQGSKIVVKAKDDFRVAGVTVSIHTPAGTVLEEGAAVLNPIKRNQWIYTTTQTNGTVAGTVIKATASDLPGNTATLEVTV